MFFLYFFWFTMCTSIIFFLPYCKNLCTFFIFFDLQCAHQLLLFFSIVRIYILSLFFVYTSIIFFFYKNLCTFFFVSVYSVHFRIRINVLESILICLESMYFFFFILFTVCKINVLEIGYVS